MEAKTIEQLEQELKELKSENEMLQEINKELTLEIESLKATPDAPLADGLVNRLSFENAGKTYGFKIAGVNLDGDIITAEQVVKDKALQAKLIKMQSGMIAEIA